MICYFMCCTFVLLYCMFILYCFIVCFVFLFLCSVFSVSVFSSFALFCYYFFCLSCSSSPRNYYPVSFIITFVHCMQNYGAYISKSGNASLRSNSISVDTQLGFGNHFYKSKLLLIVLAIRLSLQNCWHWAVMSHSKLSQSTE